MIRNQMFFFVSRCLAIDGRPDFRSEVEAVLQSGQISWEELVWVASRHFVLPALYASLRRHSLLHLLPDELVSHLEDIYLLNADRNRNILQQAGEIARELSAQGIRPVFLKGTGYLLQNLYADPAERIMIDIDLLVDSSQAEKARLILIKMGYRYKVEVTASEADLHHHFPMMIKPGRVAGVELHRQATHSGYLKFLPTDEILQDARPVLSGMAAVPGLYHQVVIHFFHDQIIHWHFENRNQMLRGLFDFYLLTEKPGLHAPHRLNRKYRNKINAYGQLTASIFEYPGYVTFPNHLFSRYYMFTWKLLNQPTRPARLLHKAVIRINRLIYLSRFIAQATYRPDRRRHILLKIKKLTANLKDGG
jgi:hypothetical protein